MSPKMCSLIIVPFRTQIRCNIISESSTKSNLPKNISFKSKIVQKSIDFVLVFDSCNMKLQILDKKTLI